MLTSLITKNNTESFNTAVNAINRLQTENLRKLESAFENQNTLKNRLNELQAKLNVELQRVKNQVFINDSLIYTYKNSGLTSSCFVNVGSYNYTSHPSLLA